MSVEPSLANRLKGLNQARKTLANTRDPLERETAREWLNTPEAGRTRLEYSRLLARWKRRSA